MLRSPFFVTASAFAASVTCIEAQGTPPQARVVGTWLLESVVDTLRDGSVSYWMGRHPTGAIVYTPSGHVTVQFARDPRPALPMSAASGANTAQLAGTDPFGALDAESLRDVVRGYYAYFGRYRVSAAGDSITHVVETSLRPNEVGVTYRRAIRMEGNRLYISLNAEENGVPRHRVLTWTRAP